VLGGVRAMKHEAPKLEKVSVQDHRFNAGAQQE
jgi:hypothetical protein